MDRAGSAFLCNSSTWQTHNAEVVCGELGGQSDALEVKDKGGWSHAYQQMTVESGAVYNVTGLFFAEADNVCDASIQVRWCSLALVICTGPYEPQFYEQGDCPVGVSAEGFRSWELFSARFVPGAETMTLYLIQEATAYSSWSQDLRIEMISAPQQAPQIFHPPPASVSFGCLLYSSSKYHRSNLVLAVAQPVFCPQSIKPTLMMPCGKSTRTP